MTGNGRMVSDHTRRAAQLSHNDLWMRYFELGGMSTPREVRSFLRHRAMPTDHDYDVLAQALNERFSELGRNPPVRYAENRP